MQGHGNVQNEGVARQLDLHSPRIEADLVSLATVLLKIEIVDSPSALCLGQFCYKVLVCSIVR